MRRLVIRPAGWWFDALLLAGFVGLTAGLAAGWLLDLDVAVQDWCDGHRPRPAYWTARVLNMLGSGGTLTVICLLVAAALGLRGRTVRPLLPVVAAFLLTGFAVLPVKLWTDRAAPTSNVVGEVELFNVPSGLSYPSGHLVNTIVWYGVLMLLIGGWLPRSVRGWVRAVPPVIVLATTVYLSYHWVTDSVAGALVGLLLWRLLARVPWADLPLRRRQPVASAG